MNKKEMAAKHIEDELHNAARNIAGEVNAMLYACEQAMIDKVLEIIDQMDKENEECNGDPARALLRIEHDDFRERVMELKGGEQG